MLAIETYRLAKHYGDTKALDGIDLKIRKGSVYGILGPNGAGKTTAIRILTTLARPTGGSATVLGLDVVHDAKQVRTKIALTGQGASVDDDLTAQENLIMMGRLLGMSWKQAKTRATEMLAAFDLADSAKKLVSQYSGGMRRRLDIAASLLATPEILFLDEPTTGLDPRSRNQVWDIVRDIAAGGTTVVLTTQYLEEADKLAERLAVIDHGRVIAEGTSDELKASVGGNTLHVRITDDVQRAQARVLIAKNMPGALLPEGESRQVGVKLTNVKQAATIITNLNRNGIDVQDFAMGSPSLDDVFFALTGKPAESQEAP